MTLEVRAERPDDAVAIRRVHDAAFGRPAEGRLVDALRRAHCVAPNLSLVAVTAAALGCRAVIVVGDPTYYGRFGFSQALAAPLASPYAGPHQQALELVAGVLSGARAGRVSYPAPFAEVS